MYIQTSCNPDEYPRRNKKYRHILTETHRDTGTLLHVYSHCGGDHALVFREISTVTVRVEVTKVNDTHHRIRSSVGDRLVHENTYEDLTRLIDYRSECKATMMCLKLITEASKVIFVDTAGKTLRGNTVLVKALRREDGERPELDVAIGDAARRAQARLQNLVLENDRV